jgi:uncharacterized protein
MRTGSSFTGIFILFFCVASFVADAQRAIPELWGVRVHDEAGVLSSSKIQQLETQLKQHEDSTSNQIAILIIPSLDGEVLEEYSLKVAEKWQLGTKEKDNGVLLLIAVDDRKMRIEVGYGLEGPLPDITCNQIIRNEIAPEFRRNDYDAGVQAGIDAITRAIAGEYVVDDGSLVGEEIPWFVGLFVFGVLGLFSLIGLLTKGGPGWFLYVFLIPFYAAFPFALYGWETGKIILLGHVIGYPILKIIFRILGWSTLEASSGGGSSGGGWSSGGSSWSSGGGGFSGGGGSFGGGGSSGSW